MPSYVNPFTGQTIQPSQVGYESLSIATDTILQWPVNGNDNLVVANIIDVTATAANLKLYLPAATQVSVGQSVLINNIGATTFTVVKSDGTTISAITSGISKYIYLTDNATTAGTWTSVTFGAGTSAANAATLAGYGLTALSTTLNQAYSVVTYYSSTTLASTDRAEFAVWAGGVGSFALPSAASVGNNWFCMIANNGSGILTLTPQGTDTINGNASQQLQLTESLVIVSNGTGWNTFGYGRSNAFAYTQLALNVTGGSLTLTSAQASNTIQGYSGILTSNQIVIVPSTVQLYTVTNNTTGAFSFTMKTAVVGGATVVVPQGNSLVLICDGTNVYNAASGSASSITALTLGNGSLAVPSLKFSGDANSGLYLPSSGTLGFVIGNALAGSFTASGFTATNGIAGGTF
tara:strand:- start:42123 stop:43340 length:1218 start_codon:yes stop_codon:yes gene_type:complete